MLRYCPPSPPSGYEACPCTRSNWLTQAISYRPSVCLILVLPLCSPFFISLSRVVNCDVMAFLYLSLTHKMHGGKRGDILCWFLCIPERYSRSHGAPASALFRSRC